MKPDKIVFIDLDLEDIFNRLDKKDPLKKALVRTIRTIEEDCYCGRQVKKSLIPKRLIEKYSINNLWIYNLPDYWRLLYSLTNSMEIELIAVILDWMSHKDYEKLFGF